MPKIWPSLLNNMPDVFSANCKIYFNVRHAVLVFYPVIFREISRIINLFIPFLLEEVYLGLHLSSVVYITRWTHMEEIFQMSWTYS